MLSKFSKEETEIIKESVSRAADAVLEVIEHGLQKAMNKYNVRTESTDPECQQ